VCVARTDSTSIVTRRAAGALTTPVIADADVAAAYAMDVTMFTSLPLATRETMRARLSEAPPRHDIAEGTRLSTTTGDMYVRVFNTPTLVDGVEQPQPASPIARLMMQLHSKVVEYHGIDRLGYVHCIDSLIIATDLIIVGIVCMQINLSCTGANQHHRPEVVEGGNRDRTRESSTD
jgi:hypothetical protein